MAEIIEGFGEVTISLKEYNEMRDKIRKQEEDNDVLVAERDQICDENKVRVRRQIIRETRLTYNPREIGTKEVIEDRLVNCEDLRKEIDDKIHECEEGWKKKAEELQTNLDRAEKSLEQCQRQKFDVEQQLAALKSRGWWHRLLNK